MPRITAECGQCGSNYYGDQTYEIEDKFARCSECCNDVCPHCGDVKESIHKTCKESRDYENDEEQVPLPAKRKPLRNGKRK